MRAMLLSAGLGTRLRPVTTTFAKPAVPFLGVPLMYWSLEFLKELKLDRVVANLHYLPDTIRPLSTKLAPLEIRFTHEVQKPLGSGGALWFAKKELEDSETILVANADEVILPVNDRTLIRMLEQHEKSDAVATLLTMRRPDAGTKFGGVWTAADHSVMGFGFERSAFPSATQALHYVGVLLLNRRIFKYVPDGESNILYDVVAKAIANGERVMAFSESLVWHETGNPTDFLTATYEMLEQISFRRPVSLASALAQRIVQKYGAEGTRLWESYSGAMLLASTYAEGSIGESVICEALEKEKAFAVIGSNAFIEAPVLNSVIFAGAQVPKEARGSIVV